MELVPNFREMREQAALRIIESLLRYFEMTPDDYTDTRWSRLCGTITLTNEDKKHFIVLFQMSNTRYPDIHTIVYNENKN